MGISENEVILKLKDKVRLFQDENGSYGSFQIVESCVSYNEKHELNTGTIIELNKDGSMIFKANRSSSGEPVIFFNHEAGRHNTYGYKLKDSDDMYFAVKGNLRLNLTGGIFGDDQYVCVLSDIVFAQGSSCARNLWWCGCKNAKRGFRYRIKLETDYKEREVDLYIEKDNEWVLFSKPNVFKIGFFPRMKGVTHGYFISTKTGDVIYSGTDGTLHATLYGEFGKINDVILNKNATSMNAFERGDVDCIRIGVKENNKIPDIGRVYAIMLKNDMDYAASGWYLEDIHVRHEKYIETDIELDTIQDFDCDKYNSVADERDYADRDSAFYINDWIDDNKERYFDIPIEEWEKHVFYGVEYRTLFDDDENEIVEESYELKPGEIRKKEQVVFIKEYGESSRCNIDKSEMIEKIRMTGKLSTEDFVIKCYQSKEINEQLALFNELKEPKQKVSDSYVSYLFGPYYIPTPESLWYQFYSGAYQNEGVCNKLCKYEDAETLAPDKIQYGASGIRTFRDVYKQRIFHMIIASNDVAVHIELDFGIVYTGAEFLGDRENIPEQEPENPGKQPEKEGGDGNEDNADR